MTVIMLMSLISGLPADQTGGLQIITIIISLH